MTARELAAAASCLVGAFFFLAGTVGVLRFPDAASRLHAVAKADTVGLGFTVLGLALLSPSGWGALRLVLVWALALVAGATNAHLLVGVAVRDDAEGEPGG